MEQWKKIPELPEYSISSEGRVRKDADGTLVGLSKNNGYVRLTVSKHIHRLVAQAFIEKPDEERCWVDHIDGDRSNNSVENLRWVTPSENCLAFGYESRKKNKRRKVKAVHENGEEIIFDSRQDAARYFKCADSEIKYGYQYKKGNKKGFTLYKVEDIV